MKLSVLVSFLFLACVNSSEPISPIGDPSKSTTSSVSTTSTSTSSVSTTGQPSIVSTTGQPSIVPTTSQPTSVSTTSPPTSSVSITSPSTSSVSTTGPPSSTPQSNGYVYQNTNTSGSQIITPSNNVSGQSTNYFSASQTAGQPQTFNDNYSHSNYNQFNNIPNNLPSSSQPMISSSQRYGGFPENAPFAGSGYFGPGQSPSQASPYNNNNQPVYNQQSNNNGYAQPLYQSYNSNNLPNDNNFGFGDYASPHGSPYQSPAQAPFARQFTNSPSPFEKRLKRRIVEEYSDEYDEYNPRHPLQVSNNYPHQYLNTNNNGQLSRTLPGTTQVSTLGQVQITAPQNNQQPMTTTTSATITNTQDKDGLAINQANLEKLKPTTGSRRFITPRSILAGTVAVGGTLCYCYLNSEECIDALDCAGDKLMDGLEYIQEGFSNFSFSENTEWCKARGGELLCNITSSISSKYTLGC